MSRTFIFRHKECGHDSAAQRFSFDKKITEDTTIICQMQNYCRDCTTKFPEISPDSIGYYELSAEEKYRAEGIWSKLAAYPRFINPLSELEWFQQRDFQFMLYVMTILDNDLRCRTCRWKTEGLPRPTFAERQLVLQVRQVVQRMFIKVTMETEELSNDGTGEWHTFFDEHQQMLVSDIPLEWLKDDEKECIICTETFGESNDDGRIPLPCRTICQHLFCRFCLSRHMCNSSFKTGAGDNYHDELYEYDGPAEHDEPGDPEPPEENDAASPTYTVDSNESNDVNPDDERSEAGDSETGVSEAGSFFSSQYSQYSESSVTPVYIPRSGWPLCPLCNFEFDMEEYLGPGNEVNSDDHPSPPWMKLFRPLEWDENEIG